MIIDIHILNLSSFDHIEALLILPCKIRSYALGLKLEKKRIEYIASQWLRYKLLSESLCIDINSLRFAKTNTGRPFLTNKAVDFNISHTRHYAMIAIAKDQRIGVDVQTKKKVDILAISKQYFAESEYCLITSEQNEFLRRHIFYWLWVYKEASLKLTGEGIANGLNRYVFRVNKNGICKHSNVKDKYYFHQQLDENTLMCLSFEKSNSKIILHFL